MSRRRKRRGQAERVSHERWLVSYSDFITLLFAFFTTLYAISTVDQQKAQLAQLEAAIRGNDAAIRAAEVRLSYTRIVAPVDGRVGLRRVDPGNLVRPGDAGGLFTVTQMDPIAVRFSLPQDQLTRLAPFLANPAAAPVVAYEREGGARLAEGHLAVVDNEVDPTTGTISLKAEMPNKQGRLWPGQFVAVELVTGVTQGATVVSSRVVQRGRDGAFVFRVHDGKAAVVPVKIAWQDDRIAVVAEGLAPGDTVVSDGQSRLKPGSLVNVVERPGAQTTQADAVGGAAP